jgi:hypothetical protein
MVISNEYVMSKKLTHLKPPYNGLDNTYADDRKDEQQIDNGVFQHCVFVNISFKQATISHITFSNCTFVRCYFRKTAIESCSFNGCRFIECDFPKLILKDCKFRYCRFKDCAISYSIIELSLPQEPNLREALCRELSIESEKMGLTKDSIAFKFAAIQAHEKNLKLAIKGQGKWYKTHYDTCGRVKSFFQLMASYINRHLWGYGLKARILLRNYAVMALIVFPLWYLFLKSHLIKKGGFPIDFGDTLCFSLSTILFSNINCDLLANSLLVRFSMLLETIIGLVLTGLFVSYTFKWIVRK